jgi:hypothetical protein
VGHEPKAARRPEHPLDISPWQPTCTTQHRPPEPAGDLQRPDKGLGDDPAEAGEPEAGEQAHFSEGPETCPVGRRSDGVNLETGVGEGLECPEVSVMEVAVAVERLEEGYAPDECAARRQGASDLAEGDGRRGQVLEDGDGGDGVDRAVAKRQPVGITEDVGRRSGDV